MHNEQFEQRLRRQPPHAIPPHWRAQILAAAQPAPARKMFQFSAFSFQLFPALRWSALAAVWLVIFALHHATRDASPVAEAKIIPPSPQMRLALREQKKLFAELAGLANEPTVADPPKSNQPRSGRQPKNLFA